MSEDFWVGVWAGGNLCADGLGVQCLVEECELSEIALGFLFKDSDLGFDFVEILGVGEERLVDDHGDTSTESCECDIFNIFP